MLYLLLLFIKYVLSEDIGYVMHISDIHYDKYYREGTPTSCVFGNYYGLRCCHTKSIPAKNDTPAGRWGDFNCDTPIDLVNYTFSWISENIPNIDYIIWTGDSASHQDLIQSYEMNIDAVNTLSLLFKEYFKDVRVLPVIGNHDTFPVDQLSPPNPDTYITRTIGRIWKEWIGEEQLKTFRKGGYYTFTLKDGFRIIGLNCLYHDKNNLFDKGIKDPADQDKWLENVLKNASINNEKVWLVSHIPPTSSTKSFTRLILNLVKENLLIRIYNSKFNAR
jgi:sphingomyelin phosphodiesterase